MVTVTAARSAELKTAISAAILREMAIAGPRAGRVTGDTDIGKATMAGMATAAGNANSRTGKIAGDATSSARTVVADGPAKPG